MSADIRLGRWQDVLADVTCDALICDPPYSAQPTKSKHHRKPIAYDAWTPDNVGEFVSSWSPRVRGWFVAFTSHDLAPCYAAALQDAGRYVFAPLPWLNEGGPIRLSGDGPSSWTCWIVVARPKTQAMQRWGTLPGGYHSPNGAERAHSNATGILGSKPLGLMRAIVRDYSRPGDLVCDPFLGSGTTAIAALSEGRRFVGSEEKPEHMAIIKRRLARGHTVDMFAGVQP